MRSLEPADPTAQTGERIGLLSCPSDADSPLWPRPGTELTIDLNATSLELPVVGGKYLFRRATGNQKIRAF